MPTGVCVTHDKGNRVVFAYIGGHRKQRAKRFNPRVLGSLELAVKCAAYWRREMEGSAA